MKYIPVIIILLCILAIAGAVFACFCYIRNKARQFSKSLWGTDNLAEGMEQMKREYASTPKSVSAMTSLLLPKIVSDFPDFQYDEMKERAKNLLITYLRAVSEHRQGLLQDGNEELHQKLQNHLEMLSAKGLKERYEQIRIHRTEISQYRNTDGRCIITFQSSCEYYHYITDDTGNVIEGKKDLKYQTKYNIDLIYIQDRNLVNNELDQALGLTCPNCGAPISSLGAKVCEYCETPVIELNIRVWSFSNLEEVK